MSKKHNSHSVSSSKVDVDIVIAVHRRIDLLEKCLASIPEAVGDVSYQVIIFDNATPPEEKNPLYAKLRNKPGFVLSENTTNLGFPMACNRGARRGNAPLIFFLNSDVILDPGSVKHLVDEMQDDTIGITGMKLVFPENPQGLNPNIRPAGKIQHVGLMTNIRGEVVHAYMAWDEYHPKVMAMREVLGVTGAALMTRRSIWNKLGGFLEDYGMGTFEDIDFCMKCREANNNVVVVPLARGVHYTGATAEKYQLPYPLQMNQLLFMQRWAGKLPWTEWQSR
jgi:O-antigen biosynthesis protein